MISIRRATADDARAIAGGTLPADWCIGAPVGWAAERDGEVIALGAVTWDRYGRAWGWFSGSGAVPAITMHRKAREMLAMLREAGEPTLYAICNTAIPGADTWLRRLGFVEAPDMHSEAGPVWQCNL